MQKAFLKIVDENQGIIYKVCKMYRDSSQDQEDLYQEIVLQLWKSYSKFRNDSKGSTWMYRIALNTAIATFRKNKIELEFKDTIPKDYHLNYTEEQVTVGACDGPTFRRAGRSALCSRTSSFLNKIF